LQIYTSDFLRGFDYFEATLKENGQPSAVWIGIPSFGTMRIPRCDFGAMTSPAHLKKFIIPVLPDEVEHMTHNIFHVDGQGVAHSIWV